MTRELNLKCVNDDAEDTLSLHIEATKETYHSLLRAIRRSAQRIEVSIEAAPEKEIGFLERNLTLHNKTIGEIQKLEGGLGDEQSKSKSVALDLDGARHEIFERISRIRAARGD